MLTDPGVFAQKLLFKMGLPVSALKDFISMKTVSAWNALLTTAINVSIPKLVRVVILLSF